MPPRDETMPELVTAIDDYAGNGHSACPIHDLIPRPGDKWSVLVVRELAKAEHDRLRFSELMRAVSGISQRMFAKRRVRLTP